MYNVKKECLRDTLFLESSFWFALNNFFAGYLFLDLAKWIK